MLEEVISETTRLKLYLLAFVYNLTQSWKPSAFILFNPVLTLLVKGVIQSLMYS